MENAVRDMKAKGLVNYDTFEIEIQVGSEKKVKYKKEKGKLKSGDTSNSSPIPGISNHSQDRVDSLQSLVSWKKGCNTMSARSLSKNALPAMDAPFTYEVALQQLFPLNFL